ncbi:MAG: hypothetical protein SFU25_07635 [Candidatus Caenarcaniphilales bacterium]|nr:hypothetical protein [Candidatus Caenarcaniphilales bacterium]
MEDNPSPVIVMCMKWGNKYGPEYVNRLKNGVKRHLKRPHRFICFTDNCYGINEDIEIYPISERKITIPKGGIDACWRKIDLYQKDLFGLEGTALYLDLDLVIFESLDPFFDLPGEFLIIREKDLVKPKILRKLRPNYDKFHNQVGNSSVFRFQIGKHTYIYENFWSNPEKAIINYHMEQDYLSAQLIENGVIGYWPKGWCVSFKNQCIPNGLISYLKNPFLPKNTKMVVFAGSLKMSDVMEGKGHKWYRRIGKSDWLLNAWLGKEERIIDNSINKENPKVSA